MSKVFRPIEDLKLHCGILFLLGALALLVLYIDAHLINLPLIHIKPADDYNWRILVLVGFLIVCGILYFLERNPHEGN